ncbi:RNA polymerase sigma factor SigF [Streptomyces sp. NPDC057302]|uniref:RNA polymerase sigma factor SigF n=1 Tax=Streptomyces sp. NPDC057302 TaxID=3346094 RepID=UPI0036451398
MVASTPSSQAPRVPLAERHTDGPDIAAAEPTFTDPPLAAAGGQRTADLRALSKTLFTRLDALEEGTPEHSYVRNSLVELNLNLVRYAAHRMRPRDESYEDVVQVGTIGLIKAINRFELERGVEFPTFALPTIMGEIKRFFRDTTWAVRVPRRLQELRLDLVKATTDLEQTNGHAPTTAELAAHLDLDEAEISEGLTAANGYTTSSLDFPADGVDSDDTLADHVGYRDPELDKVEDLHSLKPLIAALPERDRKILAMRFAADMTQSEIGAELGISQMHVSRILSRVLGRLRVKLLDKR